MATSLHPYLPYTVWVPVASERFCIFEASDPRASGRGTMKLDTNAYPNTDATAERGPEASWGTIRFENDVTGMIRDGDGVSALALSP